MQKGIIKKEQVPQKKYNYELEGVTLNFTLRQDVKNEMVKFSKLLEQAIKDIDLDLTKFDKK